MPPIILNKKKGLTPLELVKKYKKENNVTEKVCYAGRLDPMARGMMILLRGVDCKLMTSYCNLNKTYEFTVLYGFKTDTYDLLGKVTDYKTNIQNIEFDLNKFTGKIKQIYPSYSSIIIKHNGIRRPLWEWTKMGLYSEIDIPYKDVEIYSLKEIDYETNINDSSELKKYIIDNINLLSEPNKKKFRVEEILELWNKIFEENKKIFKPVIKKYVANVSSGTYIRSLTHRIGDFLGYGAITLDINRLKIEY